MNEGIIPALESSHALAQAIKMAEAVTEETVFLVNLSGRGDKDLAHVQTVLEAEEQNQDEWANELYSSDYFQQLYDWAILMVKEGKAYVAMSGWSLTNPASSQTWSSRSAQLKMPLCCLGVLNSNECTSTFLHQFWTS